MSTAQTPAAPPKPKRSTVEYVEYDKYIDRQVERTRRAVKAVELSQAMLVLVIGLIGFLLAVAIIEHWIVDGGLGTLGRVLLFLVMLGSGGYYLYRYIWPLVAQQINPAYAAVAIEREHPTLKNSLLNFLMFRGHKREMPGAVYEALEEDAAQRLSQTSVDDSIDRSPLVKLGYVLLAVITAAIIYAALSPKSSLTTAARVLMPWANIATPSRVRITDVEPGNTEMVQGDAITISANIYGLDEDEVVQLSFDTADGHRVDRRVEMQAANDAGRFACTLPTNDAEFGLAGISQDLTYRILAGDGRTIDYQLYVLTAPTIRVRRVHYDFPEYTGYLDRTIEDRGDIRAIEGTKVTIVAEANTDIESAYIDLAADGTGDKRMTVDGSTAQIEHQLTLDEGRQAIKSSTYMVRFTSIEGLENNEPPQHTIEILPDYAPEVELLEPSEPERDIQVNETVEIAVDARDPDFALRTVALKFAKQDGSEVHEELLLDGRHEGRFDGKWQFTPIDHKLKPGDVVEYWAEATDVRLPQAGRTKTERKQFRVVGDPNAGNEQQQGEGTDQGEGQPGEGQQGEGEQGESGEQGEGGQGEGGQGEGGQQGNGAQGEGGEQGEAGGDGPASGEQQGQQTGEGQAGEGAQSKGGNGTQGGDEQNGEQSSSRDQQGEGGASGQSNATGESTDSEGDPNQSGQGGQSGGGENSRPVANDGSDDAEAFERMQQHLNEEQRQNATRQQRERGGGENADAESGQSTTAEQTNADNQADGNQATGEHEANGERSNDSQQANNGESTGEREDADTEKADGDRQDKGSGADTRSDAPQSKGGEQNDTKPDGVSQSSGDDQRDPSGEPGAGSETEPQGSPEAQRELQQRPKRDGSGDEESESDQTEPPAPGKSKKESDSRGEQGGDRTGGGEEGGGQNAPREGTGSDGQNQAADEGAGQSADQGPGETGQRGGDSRKSDKPTGKPGQEQGNGSEQRDGQGNEQGGKPSDKQPGEGQQTSSDSTNQNAAQQQDRQPADPNQQPQSDAESRGNKSSSPTGNPAANDGAGDGPEPGKFDGTLADADDANLEYAREQTNLVLDNLEDQLEKNEVDKELLDKLGWNKDDLKKFVDRWNKLRADAERPNADAARQELDARLRNLGPSIGPKGGTTKRTLDDFRDLSEGYQNKVPLKYRDRLRAYTEGVSGGERTRD